MDWQAYRERNRQWIPYEPEDDSEYQSEIQTMHRDQEKAQIALSGVPRDILDRLETSAIGFGDLSGSLRLHLIHRGTLTGKQFKYFIMTIVGAGGDVFEAFAFGAPDHKSE